ncbi:MAG: urea ABC transporter permease subunit UrtB [Magnetococcus sp. WYHC-3]
MTCPDLTRREHPAVHPASGHRPRSWMWIWLWLTWALFPPALAQAATPQDLAGLGADSFKVKLETVLRLAASGDAEAVPALQALLDGQLMLKKSDRTLVITRPSGSVLLLADPSTGASLGQDNPENLTKIRINNQLRTALRAALGGLTLLSPDPVRRHEAALAVFRSRDPELLSTLVKALEREEVAEVRSALARALAALQLTHGSDLASRIQAAHDLASAGGQDVRALLAEVAATDMSADPPLRAAVNDALNQVEERLRLWSLAGSLFQGISLGSVLLLAAVGLAITFGVMGVINMAHGELIMLGAYTTFLVQKLFLLHWPAALDAALLVAVPAAFLVAGAAGIAIERGIIRQLYGRPLETLLATWGLSLILQQLVRSLFGPTNQEVQNPTWMSGAVETSQGLVLTYNRMAILVFSLAVIGILALVLRRTRFGLQMRAVTQNRRMAGSMGIRTGWVDALTFGLGSGIAGVAGVALSQIDNVSPNLGQSYIIDSFMVVVFGGVGNLWGTLVGAFSLGILNKFLEPLAGAVLGKILVLVAIILFIQKRPRGIFALKGRAVEV